MVLILLFAPSYDAPHAKYRCIKLPLQQTMLFQNVFLSLQKKQQD